MRCIICRLLTRKLARLSHTKRTRERTTIRTLFVDKEWDYHDLWRELFPIGVDMILESVSMIEKGTVEGWAQDERFATFEPSWDRPRLKRNELLQLGGAIE